MTDDRDAIQQRERGKATVRALYLSELQDVKKRRSAALREAEAQLDRLARLLPSATDAGLTLSEIAIAAEVSRPTIYQLRARFSDNDYDLKLALLQTIANLGRARTTELKDMMGGEADRIPSALNEMMDSGLIVEDFNDEPADPAMEMALTQQGFDALEQWDFDEMTPDAEVGE